MGCALLFLFAFSRFPLRSASVASTHHYNDLRAVERWHTLLCEYAKCEYVLQLR